MAEEGSHRVRCINPVTKQVGTVAGTGKAGHSDGSALQARFTQPIGLAFHRGKLYIGDYRNHVIRELDLATSRLESALLATQLCQMW